MSVKRDQVNIDVIINGDRAGDSLTDLRKLSRELAAELSKLPTNTEEFKKKAAELREVDAKLSQIRKEVKGVGDAFETTKTKAGFLKDLLTAEFFKRVIDGAIEFGKECITAFTEAEMNSAKLEFALTNITKDGGSFDRLIEQSSKLQDKSIFSDDDIQRAQTAMAQYGLTVDQIERLTPQIIDLATAQGIDLATATDKAVSAINGQSKGLKDAGIQFEDTGSKTENFNILTDKLTKFQGSAALSLENTAGKAERFKNKIDDMKESVGEFLVGAGEGFLDFWDFISNNSDAKIEKAFRQQEREAAAHLKVLTEQLSAMSEETLTKDIAFQKNYLKLLASGRAQMKGKELEDEIKYAQQRLQIGEKLAAEEQQVQDDLTIKGQQQRDAANEQRIKQHESLLGKISTLNEEAMMRDLKDDERVIKATNLKYDKLVKEAKGHNDIIVQLEKLRQSEIDFLKKEQAAQEKKEADKKKKDNDKLEKERRVAQDKIYHEAQTSRNQEMDAVSNHFEELILQARELGESTLALEEERERQMQAIAKKYRDEDLKKSTLR